MTISQALRLMAASLMALVLPGMPGLDLSASAQEATQILSREAIEVDERYTIGLSPDGNLFAAADREKLCVYDVPAITQVACADLSPLEAGLRVGDVSWSPDSTRLVLTENSFQLLRDGDLWVVDALTGDLLNLTDDGFNGNIPLMNKDELQGVTLYFDVAPAWSPDGESITFSRSTFRNGDMAGNDIVRVPAAGGEPELLRRVSGVEVGIIYMPMRWSADGASLYYSLQPLSRDDPSTGIYRYDDATGETEKILGLSPELGPPMMLELNPADGTMLVFYPIAAGQFGTIGPLLWLLDPATGDLEPVDPTGAPPADSGLVVAATFSPDGTSLLVGISRSEFTSQLWETDLATGESYELINDLEGVFMVEWTISPSWTASGRIFVASGPGAGTLLEVPPQEAPSVDDGSTPVASPAAVGNNGIVVGETVIVISDGVPLYSAPSSLSQAVLLLGSGDLLTVLAPAQEADGAQWLPVQHIESLTIGFVRIELVTKS